MASVTLVDVRLLMGGYEVSADHYQGSLTRTRNVVQATTFGNSSHVYRPGLKQSAYSLAGYFDSDGSAGVNDIYAAQLAASVDQVVTIVSPDGLEGSRAYTLPGVHSEVQDFGGSIGDMAAFQVSGSGSGDSFGGQLLEDGTTARSSSGTGTAVQLTDITTGEVGRAALHVIAATGSPTLDVVVQSDSTGGFGSPTSQITFAQATGIGAEIATTSGTTTDDYWRVSWTFGGTGSVTFVVNFGIA